MAPAALAAANRGRPHAALPERRADNWDVLHATFVREARESGIAGRARCRVLFLGDSITEAMRGTQYGEQYDELKPRRKVFEEYFVPLGARAFGISGDRTQHLLWRIQNGELQFRHAPEVVVVCVGTNNIGRDGDGAEDTFLGVVAVVSEVLHRLPGSRVLLPGVLPRGPGTGDPDAAASMLPGAPGVSAEYQSYAAPKSASAEAKAAAENSKFGQPGLYTPTIAEVNRRLRAFSEESDGAVTYCDCQSVFLTPTGSSIIPALMRDALHPTARGMVTWFSVLGPAVRAMMSKPHGTLEVGGHGAHAAESSQGLRSKL
jgi:lysophospholipase L1-like esterase